jgi:hypothetical protein
MTCLPQTDSVEEGGNTEGIMRALVALNCCCRFLQMACCVCILTAPLSLLGPAVAASTSLSAQISNERNPDDFSDILDNVYKFEAMHRFDDDVYVNGFYEFEVPDGGGPYKDNLEGNLGYQHMLFSPISLFGSVGIGERFTEDNDFPYYVFRAGIDLSICDQVTWNIVTLRYRNAFDTANDYKTPRLTTKVTFRIDEQNAVYGELYRSYDEDWDPTATGLAIGYAFSFE